MRIALAVIVPTLLLAYLAAWRASEPWHDRRAMHPVARGMLWASLALSAAGFGVVLLWAEILAIHLGHIPGWGARAYAPAIETVAAIDAISLALAGVVHAITLNRRGAWAPHRAGEGFPDAAGDLIDLAQDIGAGAPGRTAAPGIGSFDAGASHGLGGSGGGASWEWPSLGLDLGEDGALIAVGIGLFLLAAFLVALSLVGGGFATYAVLRLHARP